jgi:hypothetical protein
VARFYANASIRTADDLIDITADRLGITRPAGAPRDALRQFVNATATPFAWNANTADRTGRGVVHLLLAGPDAQLQ